MSMGMSVKPDAIAGRLDPVLSGKVTGWIYPAKRVTLTVDGTVIGTAMAAEPRQFALRRLCDERCGFAIDPPRNLFDGAVHEIRVTTDDGHDIPGSPMRFRSRTAEGAVEGVVERVAGNVVHVKVRRHAGAPDLPIAVAGIAGDETVAIAVARVDPVQPAGSWTSLVLVVPEDVIRSGHRLIHVGLIGTDRFLGKSPALLPALRPSAVSIRQRAAPVTLAVKIAAPNARVAHEWGDYHFARQLGAALQRRGWAVRVDCQEEWSRTGDDVTLVLRGRHRYKPDGGSVNLMWMISHPDRMAPDEPADYDHIFVASDIYARILGGQTQTPVSALHQAADPGVFRPPPGKSALPSPVLFVGNSRREYRTIVRWCVETGIDVAVYGSLWDNVIPAKLIGGTYIDNADLHRWYGSCGVLLNDHWDTMRENGFLSNRLFDGSAAGAFIITDEVRGLAAVFGDAIETAADAAELKEKTDYYLANPLEAEERAKRARAIVLAGHTFDHRAEQIIEIHRRLKDSGIGVRNHIPAA
ncbi:hypothetical protein SAE02_25250 [Skermanella aerolata]|uniref:Spore protein YkvP/CgeB glycosyl transferase-like domain-containing protein n=2 Tax=Skermanella aerolata TaxID=393310 RepID=A0A512DPH2_9PROT|nr:hypothetical protein N826_39575 [Skermanella aerolata KACC 11604]GEO38377.1 hypothetical protein SAE02_25250 [Skermanella aerolata]